MDGILQSNVLPYVTELRENIVNNWFEEVGIERMDWPGNSPRAIQQNMRGVLWKDELQ